MPYHIKKYKGGSNPKSFNLPYLKQGVTIAKTGMIGKGKRITYVTTGTLNLPVNYSKY